MPEIAKTYSALEYNLIQKINEHGFSENPIIGNIQSIILERNNGKEYSYKLNQKYDLIAAIIALEHNTLGKDFIDKIKEKISTLQLEYTSTKNKDASDTLTEIAYYTALLKKLKRQKSSSILNNDFYKCISEIIKSTNKLTEQQKILKLLFEKEDIEINQTSGNITSLSNSLLQKAIRVKNRSNNQDILSLHFTCKQIEDLTLSNSFTEFDIAKTILVVKASLGNGLYIPESRVEEYLAKDAKNYIKGKYTSLLKNVLTITIKGVEIPIYILPIFAIIFEAILFKSGHIAEFSIGPFAINEQTIPKIEDLILYVINPIALAIYVFYISIKTKSKLDNVEI